MSKLSCYGHISLQIERTKSKAREMQHTPFVKQYLSESYICTVCFNFSTLKRHYVVSVAGFLDKNKNKTHGLRSWELFFSLLNNHHCR